MDTDLEGAAQVAERFRSELANSPLLHEGQSVRLTISIGLCPWNGEPLETLFEKADAALYRSKEAGRNRTTMYEESMSADLCTH